MSARTVSSARKAGRGSRGRVYSPAFVVAMVLGVGLNPVNSTLISTAISPIAAGMAISASQANMLVSVLYLACAIAQPTAGKLSEQLGSRRVFMAGAWLVIAGGLLGGLAATYAQLVVSRVLIGLGTSCGYPSAMLMVNRRAHKAGLVEPPAAMLSVLSIVGLVLIAVGPPLGGVLVAVFGWRSAFLVNVPVGVLTIVFGFVSLGKDDPVRGGSGVVGALDIPGIALFALFVSMLLLLLMDLPSVSLAYAGASAVSLVAFVARELSAEKKFVDVQVLAKDASLTLNFVRAMLTMLGAYVAMYALPQWLEEACGMQPQAAGLVILPMGVVATACSLVAARKGSARTQYVLCCSSMAVCGVLLCAASASAVGFAVVAAAVAGATLGLSMSVSQVVLCKLADSETIGTAAGLLRTFIYLGSIGAASVGGVFFTPQVSDVGMHAIGAVVAVLGLLALAMTLADRGLRSQGRAPWPGK